MINLSIFIKRVNNQFREKIEIATETFNSNICDSIINQISSTTNFDIEKKDEVFCTTYWVFKQFGILMCRRELILPYA